MEIDFSKNNNGLVPAIVQDANTKLVLMLGYMNEEAYNETKRSRRVTFFSRSRNKLWTKGEESGHFLDLVEISTDCDSDTLLVMANPSGPVCHRGTDSCWGKSNEGTLVFLDTLEAVIEARMHGKNTENSYVSSLFSEGINKMAQKVGEEAVEVVIAAKDDDKVEFLNESADLLFHFLVLLRAKGCDLKNVVDVLSERQK
ncbi:bifunctional phosphoribosyl-AMP cyclohydrolase/phosphoribosyl-ATP diphosphatase HisIE [Constantimarinum furrinae]|uniref:Histidine biosynthesis bifunctional protein HisIE n=1 Tax=Constantimarinum furrinae TaxID=2562285 RepID=A0A7G8PWI7_9FLAO|nr:bifunctional phosphoribosyl-AMP cyclohydrolase/phosphoribosyl-ATP diphosphatase HisIE [Constantimarinum furrinae]QNJ98703.1 Histidine biosynthesis bifunctional protein HisIE [Constantimarinum furrinae]